MTNRQRGIFGILILAAVSTASLAVALAAFVRRLPDPDTADRQGLFRWLVESDLRHEPRELQLRLVSRVEKELLAGIDLGGASAQLEPQQRERLLENADTLARCWFVREADRYFAAADNLRSDLLDRQIEQLSRLGMAEQLAAIEQGTARQGSEATQAATVAQPKADQLAAFSARVDRWIADASGTERSRLTDYSAALRGRILIANLRDWLPKL